MGKDVVRCGGRGCRHCTGGEATRHGEVRRSVGRVAEALITGGDQGACAFDRFLRRRLREDLIRFPRLNVASEEGGRMGTHSAAKSGRTSSAGLTGSIWAVRLFDR